MIVIDEQEVVRGHRIAVADPRGRLPIPCLHGTVLQDLAEVVDTDLLAVHVHPEVLRRQAMDAVALAILDHGLDVDDADIYFLSEEQVGGRTVFRALAPRLRPGRQNPGQAECNGQHEQRPGSAHSLHPFLSSRATPLDHPCSRRHHHPSAGSQTRQRIVHRDDEVVRPPLHRQEGSVEDDIVGSRLGAAAER